MPDRKRGGSGRKSGGDWDNLDDEVIEAPTGPFGGKIDDLVAKVVPDHLLPTVCAGAVVLVLLFFILTIIGFARSPGAAAEAEIEGIEEDKKELRVELAETKKALRDAVEARKDAGDGTEAAKKAVEAEKKRAGNVQAKLDAALETQKKLNAKIAGLQKDIKAAEVKARGADKQAKAATVQAEREGGAAEKKLAALEQRAEKQRLQFEDLRKQHDELRKEKDERAGVEERGDTAFKKIMEAVSAIGDREERIKEIKRLREESRGELAGTVALKRLDDEIEQHRRLVEKQEREAQKAAKRAVKETYDEAMKAVALAAGDFDRQMAILNEAKGELADTDYEVSVSKKMAACEAVHEKDTFTRAKRASAAAADHEARMAVLAEAKENLAGTKYEAGISKMMAAREAAHKKKAAAAEAKEKAKVAREAYKEVMAKIAADPAARDANLQALKEALPSVEGTRYGTAVQRLIQAWE